MSDVEINVIVTQGGTIDADLSSATTIETTVVPGGQLAATVIGGGTGAKGDTGAGVPNGGTIDQVLRKLSGVDQDTEWHTLAKADVGLGNVTNDAQLKASQLDTDGTLAANSATRVPAQSAVITYVASQVAAGIPDATSSVKGKIQLAGDLGGTASSPLIKRGVTVTVATAASGVLADYYCDGVDDDVQMQLAQDYAAGVGGGTVLVRAGNYLNSSTVNVSSGVKFTGEGYSTCVQLSTAGTLFTWPSGISSAPVTIYNEIENIRLDGGVFAGAIAINCGVYSQEFTIKNVWFHNFGSRSTSAGSYCIYAAGTNKKLQIIGCFFGGSAKGNSTCINLGTTGDVNIVGCNFHDFWNGVNGNTEKTQITGCNFYSGNNTAVNLGTATGGLQIVNLIGNTFADVGAYAVRIGQSAGKGANIIGNFFRNTDLSAIWLRGSNHSVIGNYFQDIARIGVGNDGHGITLNDLCSNVKIHGNSIYNSHTNMGYGIAILDTASNNNSLRSNSVTGAQIAKYRYPATSTNTIEDDNSLTLASGAAYVSSLGRNSDTTQSGFSYTTQAGGVAVKATNKSGGNYIVRSGLSTGSGTSSFIIQTPTPATNLGLISTIAISNKGSGYTAADVLTISGGGGSGATATVSSVAPAGALATVVMNGLGSGYTDGDTLTVAGGNGDATVRVRVGIANSHIITSVGIITAGTGYSATSSVALSGGTGTGATIDTTILATGAILGISLTTAGTGYALTTGAATTGGTGTGATIDVVPFDNVDTSFATRMTISNTAINVASLPITSVANPTSAQDAATKAYVDARVGADTLDYVAKTGTYTATTTDNVIDCTSGTFTVTLPTAVGITGKTYSIKNSGTGVITVATTSAQTIDGGSTPSLAVRYVSITVVSDGANWKVI